MYPMAAAWNLHENLCPGHGFSWPRHGISRKSMSREWDFVRYDDASVGIPWPRHKFSWKSMPGTWILMTAAWDFRKSMPRTWSPMAATWDFHEVPFPGHGSSWPRHGITRKSMPKFWIPMAAASILKEIHARDMDPHGRRMQFPENPCPGANSTQHKHKQTETGIDFRRNQCLGRLSPWPRRGFFAKIYAQHIDPHDRGMVFLKIHAQDLEPHGRGKGFSRKSMPRTWILMAAAWDFKKSHARVLDSHGRGVNSNGNPCPGHGCPWPPHGFPWESMPRCQPNTTQTQTNRDRHGIPVKIHARDMDALGPGTEFPGNPRSGHGSPWPRNGF